MIKVVVPILCYSSLNQVEIFRSTNHTDDYEFQLYLHASYTADTLMNREQLVNLRNAIDKILE